MNIKYADRISGDQRTRPTIVHKRDDNVRLKC